MALVDLPRLLWAMLLMAAAALAADLLQTVMFRGPGLRSVRFSDRLLVNLLFFVLLPGSIYAWFYPLVPFSGFRAGLFMALSFFLLALAPTFALFQLRTPDDQGAALGHLFWLLLKYLLVYGLLTHMYRP